MTDVERFWSKVAITSPDECWLWIGSEVTNKGYGQFTTWKQRLRQRWLAHRYAYELVKGSIPEGLKVMHSCDRPVCCNPAHLSLGTQKDNIRDALVKGRMDLRGLALGTDAHWGTGRYARRQLVRQLTKDGLSTRAIARAVNISQTTARDDQRAIGLSAHQRKRLLKEARP